MTANVLNYVDQPVTTDFGDNDNAYNFNGTVNIQGAPLSSSVNGTLINHAAGNSKVTVVSASRTIVIADLKAVLYCINTPGITLTFDLIANLGGAGFEVEIIAAGSGSVTVAGTDGQTIVTTLGSSVIASGSAAKFVGVGQSTTWFGLFYAVAA